MSPFLLALRCTYDQLPILTMYSGVLQTVPPKLVLSPTLRHQPAQKKCPPSAGRYRYTASSYFSSVPPQNPALISQAKKSVPRGGDSLQYSTVAHNTKLVSTGLEANTITKCKHIMQIKQQHHQIVSHVASCINLNSRD